MHGTFSKMLRKKLSLMYKVKEGDGLQSQTEMRSLWAMCHLKMLNYILKENFYLFNCMILQSLMRPHSSSHMGQTSNPYQSAFFNGSIYVAFEFYSILCSLPEGMRQYGSFRIKCQICSSSSQQMFHLEFQQRESMPIGGLA